MRLSSGLIRLHLPDKHSGLDVERPRADPVRVHFRPKLVRQGEGKIGDGRLLWSLKMAIAVQQAGAFANEKRRYVQPRVHVALAHAAAKEDDRMIE